MFSRIPANGGGTAPIQAVEVLWTILPPGRSIRNGRSGKKWPPCRSIHPAVLQSQTGQRGLRSGVSFPRPRMSLWVGDRHYLATIIRDQKYRRSAGRVFGESCHSPGMGSRCVGTRPFAALLGPLPPRKRPGNVVSQFTAAATDRLTMPPAVLRLEALSTRGLIGRRRATSVLTAA